MSKRILKEKGEYIFSALFPDRRPKLLCTVDGFKIYLTDSPRNFKLNTKKKEIFLVQTEEFFTLSSAECASLRPVLGGCLGLRAEVKIPNVAGKNKEELQDIVSLIEDAFVDLIKTKLNGLNMQFLFHLQFIGYSFLAAGYWSLDSILQNKAQPQWMYLFK